MFFVTACANKTSKRTQEKPTTNQSGLQHSYQSPCLQIALQNNNAAMLLGYGKGGSVNQAKQQALYDIANQIEVNVSGESLSQSNKLNNSVNTKFSNKIKTRANALLSSVEIACSDINDPSGQYHFALRYDQRDLADILTDKLIESFWQGKPNKIIWQGPSLVVQSDLIQHLNSQLVDLESAQPLTIQIKLFRKDNAWYLALNDVIKLIKDSDIAQILNWHKFTKTNNFVSLENEFGESISSHMQAGDEFRFVVNTEHSGYLSVFDVYEDGRVTKIRDNMPFNNSLTLPEHKGSFSAGLLTENQSTRDQYIFIVTAEQLDTRAFRQLMVEEDNTQDQKNYHLSKFLFWLDKQQIVTSTALQVDTVP